MWLPARAPRPVAAGGAAAQENPAAEVQAGVSGLATSPPAYNALLAESGRRMRLTGNGTPAKGPWARERTLRFNHFSGVRPNRS